MYLYRKYSLNKEDKMKAGISKFAVESLISSDRRLELNIIKKSTFKRF